MIARRVEREVPPIGSFLNVDGARMHYVERGSGRPVVMIHGLGSVLYCFTHSLVDRVATHFRVIALDRPGAGYSPRPRGASASLRAQAATIAHFIQALDLERPVIVGHSLGGAIALALALDFPAIPSALALIAPMTQPETNPPKAFRGLALEPPWFRALIAHTIAVPVSIRNGQEILRRVFKPEPVPDDFGTAAGGLLGLRPAQFYNASSDMIAGRDDMPALIGRYGELQLPVHVLFGAQDAILNYNRHGEGLRSAIPQADVRIVPGGHMLPITQPDLVASWLANVLDADALSR